MPASFPTTTVTVGNEVEVKSDVGNPVPTADAQAQASLAQIAAHLLLEASSEDAATILDAIRASTGATSDTATASSVIGRLKAIANSLATTASSWLAIRLTDGTNYLGTTNGRLQVADGGIPLNTTPNIAGDVAATLTPGRQTVTTPGTAVAIRASLACKWVQVTALKTNTGQVNAGGSGVVATAGSSTGDPLNAGESVTYPVDDANKVFVDARIAGEGVSFTVGS